MNTHAEYRRHVYQPAPEPPAAVMPDAVENHLAVGPDPSLDATSPAKSTPTGKHIAWIRPTDLHTFASPIIGRGIDLHAELARRARRVPRRVGLVAPRLTPAPHSPALDSTSQEGISL